MAESSLPLRRMLTEVRGVLESTGLKLSPSMFSVNALPKNLVDLAFTLDMQSANTGLYRGGADGVLRREETLKVTILKLVKPLDQFASQLDALTIEDNVIRAMQASDAFDYARVEWLATSSTPTPQREHLVIELTFRVEHDYTWL